VCDLADNTDDISGEAISFFADRELVKLEPRPLLRVRFVGEELPDKIVEMLPGSALDAEQRYLQVRDDELVVDA
jgi:hypothetical protein